MVEILIIAALALAVGGIIAKLISDRRKGKSGCGCGCDGCANQPLCGGSGKPRK